jgi:hypothetical protein
VKLNDRSIILYTRKKRGGDLTPRKIAMTEKLHEVLSSRFEKRDPETMGFLAPILEPKKRQVL